eukprot:scaffold6107_cov130-Isochrysis_galbana.AAC.5
MGGTAHQPSRAPMAARCQALPSTHLSVRHPTTIRYVDPRPPSARRESHWSCRRRARAKMARPVAPPHGRRAPCGMWLGPRPWGPSCHGPCMGQHAAQA